MLFGAGLLIVVFVAINPSMPAESAAPAQDNRSSLGKSGANFRRIGLVPVLFSRRDVHALTTSRICSSSCNSRKPGVFGDDTLRTNMSAWSYNNPNVSA